jgi:hypothetical protein
MEMRVSLTALDEKDAVVTDPSVAWTTSLNQAKRPDNKGRHFWRPNFLANF